MIDIELDGAAHGGLLVCYHGKLFAGFGADDANLYARRPAALRYARGSDRQKARRCRCRSSTTTRSQVPTSTGERTLAQVRLVRTGRLNNYMSDGFIGLGLALIASGFVGVTFRRLAYPRKISL